MKAVFGLRTSSSSPELSSDAYSGLSLSSQAHVKTISTDELSVVFVGRDETEIADSLVTREDWTIAVVGKIFHRDYAHQPDVLSRLLAEFRAGKHDTLRASFGEFVLVIIDKSLGAISLVSDVLAIRPVFYYVDAGHTVFGTDAWQMVSENLVRPIIDLDALSSWLLFDHVIGNNSIIKGLRRLRPASFLHISRESVREEAYKEFYIDRKDIPENHLLERVESAVSDSCHSVVARESRLNCFLSGGFDSRYLLCELEHIGADLRAYTVRYDSAEEDAAKAVLDQLGVEGSSIDVRGSVFDLHDGNPFYFAPWGFPAWKFVTEIPVRRFHLHETLVDGLMGEELVRGNDYERQVREDIDRLGIGEGMLRSYLFVDPYAFEPKLAARIRSRVKRQIEDYFTEKEGDIGKIAFQWLLFNRKSTCHTTNHLYNQASVETVHPFVSHDLVDLRLEADPGKFNTTLFKKLFSRRFPAVADIPHSGDMRQRYSGIGRFSWNLWRKLPSVILQLMDEDDRVAFRRGFVLSRLAGYGAGSANQLYLARQLWIITMLSRRLKEKGVSIPWNEI